MKNKSTSKNLLILLLTSTLSNTLMAPPFEGASAPVDVSQREISSIGVTADKPSPDQSEIGQESAEEAGATSATSQTGEGQETETSSTISTPLSEEGEQTTLEKTGSASGASSTPAQQEVLSRITSLLDSLKQALQKLLARFSPSSPAVATTAELIKTVESLSEDVSTAKVSPADATKTVQNTDQVIESYVNLLGDIEDAMKTSPTQLASFRINFIELFDTVEQQLSTSTVTGTERAMLEGARDGIQETIKELYGQDATIESLRNQLVESSVEVSPAETKPTEVSSLTAEQHIANAYDALKWAQDAFDNMPFSASNIAAISDQINSILKTLPNTVRRISNLDPTNTVQVKQVINELLENSRKLLDVQNHIAGIPNRATRETDPQTLITQYQTAYSNLVAVNALVAKLPENLKTASNSVGAELQGAARNALNSAQRLLSQSSKPISQTVIG